MTELTFPASHELAQGWTRERQVQFLDHLARNGNVSAACARVRLSREAAYRLRRRDAAFARGWAAAMVLARDANVEVMADRAIHGVEEDIWYRGELVGTRRKYDTRLLLAHVARLDKAAEDTAAQRDAGRFDELLACISGEPVPENLQSENDILPLCREESAHEAASEAEDALCQATLDESGKEPDEQAYLQAFNAGHAEGLLCWDMWFTNACDYIDLLAESDPDDPYGEQAESEPWTLSDVSTDTRDTSTDEGEAEGASGFHAGGDSDANEDGDPDSDADGDSSTSPTL